MATAGAHLERAEDVSGRIIRLTTLLSRTFHVEKDKRVVPSNDSRVKARELEKLLGELLTELKTRQLQVFQSWKNMTSSQQASNRNKYRYLLSLVRQIQQKVAQEIERLDVWFARTSGGQVVAAAKPFTSSSQSLTDEVLLAKMFKFPKTTLRKMREVIDEIQELAVEQTGFAGEELNVSELIRSFDGKERLLIKIQSMVRSFLQRRKFIKLVAKHKGSSSSLVQRQRLRVVKEIASTETTYVNSIHFCITNFYEPMKAEAEKPNGVLTPEELSLIFGSIHIIAKVNSEFLDEIESRVEVWPQTQKIGDIFVSKAPTLKLYMGYVNNFDQSSNTLAQCLTRPAFFSFLQKISEQAKSTQPLSSYLIMPIQRLPRYELLLKTLLSYLDEQHVDYHTVSEALRLITGINADVNRKKANADNINLIVKLQEQIVGEPMPLVIPSRKFIKQGEAIVISSSKFLKDNDKKTLFLFNDLLIWTEKEDGMIASMKRTGSKLFSKFQRQASMSNKRTSSSSSLVSAASKPEEVHYKYKGHLSIVPSVEIKPLSNESEFAAGCSSSAGHHGFALEGLKNKKRKTIQFRFTNETEANSWLAALKLALKSETLRQLCCDDDEENTDRSIDCQDVRLLLAAARNLPSHGGGDGLVNSFVVVKILGKEVHSKVVHKSLNPVWNEILKFHINTADDDVQVEIEVRHKTPLGVTHPKLGSATIALSALSSDQQSVIRLSPSGGELYMTLSA
eukprot:TRINITY_DN2456_c0_g1_i5.p1 TRINITY_DN2456_c0_g1~~TRINITY_DN2456_c0_g1_i5.p1  ORF type:complete len:736 (-),score=189.27 TRINITY_DN2456_c0_g1_i5:75-2282(-)